MEAAELIREGRLTDARTQLIEEVKSSPSDLGKRTTLCQVLCFFGAWDKAKRHLDAIAVQDSKREPAVRLYKNLIDAEQERRRVLELSNRPAFLPETPPYFDAYWSGLKQLSVGETDAANTLFEQVEAKRPAVSGMVNGTPFFDIRDTDSFIEFVMEIVVHERYIWMPFESIRELVVTKPQNLFDVIWSPARITSWNGLSLNCNIPVLYAGSFASDNNQIRLGRMTDWTDLGGPFARALGQRVLQIGETDMAILEVDEIVFQPPE